MSVYGTAADRVARRIRVREQGLPRADDRDSDGGQYSTVDQSKSRNQGQKQHSGAAGRTRSPSPSAADKVFAATLPNQSTQQPSPLSIWQPRSNSLPRDGASAGSTHRPGSRTSSGRSSPVPIQVVSHPIMEQSQRIARPKSRTRPVSPPHLNPKKQPGHPKKKEEDYLAYLGVHLERDDGHYYSPGETINGSIVLKLKRRVFIAGLDFRLKGKIDVLLVNGQTSHKDSETFLYHCHRMIGVWDQRATQLEPGSYVSHFKYVLPNRLPNSVTKFSSCQLRVAYGVQAILTDMNKETKQVSKTFLVHSPPFYVTPAPVYHTEMIDLNNVNLKVESSNLLIGQPCTICIDTILRISQICAHLEQTMTTGPHKVSEILNRSRSKCSSKTDEDTRVHVLRIMVPESAMVDIKRFTRAVDIEQRLHVKVKHKDTWLHYSVPVRVYPATCQYGDDMPRFDRVKRYPRLESTCPDSYLPAPVTVDIESETWIDKFSKLFKVE